MHVLVTGCGGFLGSEIVRQLLQNGDRVRGLARKKYPHLSDAGMEPMQGDIRCRKTVLEACQDVDAVIHTAAKAGLWGPKDAYFPVNLDGTRHVIDGCNQHGIGILVYTSSPSVTFDGGDQRAVDESAPYPKRWLCHYPHSKALGEQAVLSAHRSGRLHTAALRPHLIWGDKDPHLFPRLIQRARSRQLQIVGDGRNRIDVVHVVNAAKAHLDALRVLSETTPAAGGRAFFISQDEPVNCWDWISQIVHLAGAPKPTRRIGFKTAWRIGATLEGFHLVFRRSCEPRMTRFLAAQLAKDHYFDISAAKNLLGYKPSVSIADGLEQLGASWNRDPDLITDPGLST